MTATSTTTSTASPAAASTARVTIVVGTCHCCQDALATLQNMKRYYPLSVRAVPAATPAGQAVARRHRTGRYPIVLVDDGFFSAGRLPRRQLARRLAAGTS